MKRMKTFLIYALLIVVFWVFSDLLIHVLIDGKQPDSNNIENVNSQQVSIIKK